MRPIPCEDPGLPERLIKKWRHNNEEMKRVGVEGVLFGGGEGFAQVFVRFGGLRWVGEVLRKNGEC